MRFYTIFPYLENHHLFKDVGGIPMGLSFFCDVESFVVCLSTDFKSEIDSRTKFVKLPVFTNLTSVRVYLFLILNFRKIDVLNLFGLGKRNATYLILFMILKLFCQFRKGKVYIKLDAIDIDFIVNKGLLVRLSTFFCHLVSVETVVLKEEIERKKILYSKLIHIPNFLIENLLPQQYSKVDLSQKKIIKNKIILSVARFGTFQKDTDKLFQFWISFSKLDIYKEWSLILIGSVEREYEREFVNFLKSQCNVSYLGIITDRSVLFDWYQKSRYFILSSRYEGFPISFLEALYNGCAVLCTRLHSSEEIANQIPDYNPIIFEDLQNEIARIISTSDLEFENLSNRILLEYSRRYSAKTVIETLYRYLN